MSGDVHGTHERSALRAYVVVRPQALRREPHEAGLVCGNFVLGEVVTGSLTADGGWLCLVGRPGRYMLPSGSFARCEGYLQLMSRTAQGESRTALRHTPQFKVLPDGGERTVHCVRITGKGGSRHGTGTGAEGRVDDDPRLAEELQRPVSGTPILQVPSATLWAGHSPLRASSIPSRPGSRAARCTLASAANMTYGFNEPTRLSYKLGAHLSGSAARVAA